MESPSWIDKEVWDAFVEMRQAKGKRAPFTERAAKMLINELDRLRGQGHKPDEVLKQSVINGWSGVFPLKHLTREPWQSANHPSQDREKKKDPTQDLLKQMDLHNKKAVPMPDYLKNRYLRKTT